MSWTSARLKAMVPRPARRALRRLVERMSPCLFVGLRYECPFCGGRFRRLLGTGLALPQLDDIIGAGRRAAACPRCRSVDRERLVYVYLEQQTDLLDRGDPIDLLHVAPERNLGPLLRQQSRIRYVAGDLEPEPGAIELDITDLGRFGDHTFDVVLCNHVLEHVPEDGKAMAEIHRVLRPGGWAILQVPISRSRRHTYEDADITAPADRERAFGQRDHVRIYARADYVDRLRSAGFSVVEHGVADDGTGPDVTERYGLNPEEVVFVCTKGG